MKKMLDYPEDFRKLKLIPSFVLESQPKLEIFRDSGSRQGNRKQFL